MINYYLITFKNTHGAISAEKVFKAESVEAVIMPTPTTITKSCGISIRIKPEEFEFVKELVKNQRIDPANIYYRNGAEYQSVEV